MKATLITLAALTYAVMIHRRFRKLQSAVEDWVATEAEVEWMPEDDTAIDRYKLRVALEQSGSKVWDGRTGRIRGDWLP